MEIEENKEMEVYKEEYKDILEALEKGEEMNPNWFEIDSTNCPFVVNVHNPHKGKNYFKKCLVCGLKNCSNCSLPLRP